MYFRNQNDEIHYFGALILTIIIYIVILYFTESWFLSFPLAVITTNVLGLIWEALEDLVLPKWWDNDFWAGKPNWMRKHFSGDYWDWKDIALNFYGSLIFHFIYIVFRL